MSAGAGSAAKGAALSVDPAAADRVAGLYAAIDAAGLTIRTNSITRRNAGAIHTAFVAFFLEHPAAATGDAALFVALKAAGGEGGADRLTAAVVLGIATGAAGAIKGKALTVRRTSLEIAIVAPKRAGLADLGSALTEQTVGVARAV